MAEWTFRLKPEFMSYEEIYGGCEGRILEVIGPQDITLDPPLTLQGTVRLRVNDDKEKEIVISLKDFHERFESLIL